MQVLLIEKSLSLLFDKSTDYFISFLDNCLLNTLNHWVYYTVVKLEGEYKKLHEIIVV